MRMTPLRRLLGLLFVLVMFAGITGCASLGLPTPKGFDQSLAEAYGVHTAVLVGATSALQLGKLTPADATQVQTTAATARTFLDAAKTAETAGDAAGAQSKLALATSLLSSLQTFVNARSNPH